MPTFDVPLELNKNPITGLVLEPTTTDLTSPVEGLVEVRTDTHHVYVYLNGAWVRLDNPALILTADLADGAVTSAKIADGTITDVDLATANKDGLATVPSLRTLGTGTQQAAVGAHIHGGLVFFPDPTDASDIATYKRLQTNPSSASESSLVTAVTGTSLTLIAAFATDPGVPGAVDFPAGTGRRNIYAMVSTGVARLHLEVYIRSAGGTETMLRSEDSANFTNTVVQLQSWAMASATAGSLSATDRIVVKLYAQRVSGPTNFDVTTFYEGSAHTSNIETTIAAGAPVGAAGGDLTGVYPNPTIAAGKVTDTSVAAANKDGVVGTPSLRTLGTGAQQAAAGSHGHALTDAAITGISPVSKGGTGQGSAFTQGGVLYGASATAAASSGAGTAGQVLKSNGTATAPAWVDPVSLAPNIVNLSVGAIAMWGGTAATVPAGFLACDGSSYPQATYPELYAALGGASSPWGVSGGNFNVPNLTDRFPIGASGTKAQGSNGGAASIALSGGNLPAHTHGIGNHQHDMTHNHAYWLNLLNNTTIGGTSARVNGAAGSGTGAGGGTDNFNGSTGVGGATNTDGGAGLSGSSFSVLNPYAAVNFIIRAVPGNFGGGGSSSSGTTMSSPALVGGTWTTVTHNIGSTARDVSFTETVSGEARLVDWRIKTATPSTNIEVRSGVDRALNYYSVYVEV